MSIQLHRYWNVVYLIPIPPEEWRCFHRESIFDRYCYRIWTRRICTNYQYIVCILNICNYRNLPGKYRSIIIAISFNSYGIFIFTFFILRKYWAQISIQFLRSSSIFSTWKFKNIISMGTFIENGINKQFRRCVLRHVIEKWCRSEWEARGLKKSWNGKPE